MMKKAYKKTLLFLVFTSQIFFSQIGINTANPQAMLEVVAKPTFTANDKVLEVRNSVSYSLLNVKNNGNVNIGKALKPNSLAGNVGDILVSQGPNTPPVWKKSIVDAPTIQIFSAQRNTTSTTPVYSMQGRVLDFPTINTSPTADIGTWDSNTNVFTVNKKGIYHITTGMDAPGNFTNNSNLALFITTPNFYQTASGIIYPSGGGNNFSTNTILSVVLNPGDVIYISATSGSSTWYQGSSFLSILYSELP
ncbi:hypothetical protein [Chryseobacterium limigenitum]|uniref:C1q domain-containing protein n=1 Tax=Chryseobacterium limigenitum TaxID=1612149 RepID=A0A1K2IIW0_9FLAO|nr:hypothetical protein [Chryseobacterium limigenitum]SFZ92356.1 hypothetical protein SAMN05216324_103230 [Chryseobacterium limigenitum]